MKVGLEVPDDEADLSGYMGRKDNTMKTWYLADYKDENGNYHHFKKYDMSTVRIAAEDEIYYYRSKGCPVVEL